MALILPSNTSKAVSLEEYVEYVSRLDLRDQDALAHSADMLRGLANDRTLVVRKLNKLVESAFKNEAIPSAQSIFLARGEDFYVRANVWPSSADIAAGRLYQDRFAYNIAHDHNFGFMTVSYVGPGYETDIYEYDNENVEGFVGESVEIRFLEKVRFAQGMVMLYRASRDVHIQYPPSELTVTLNLMISLPEVRIRDQYYFDLQNKLIAEYPADTDSSKRVSLLTLAEHLGNDDTKQLLSDLAQAHPCRRTRLAAYEVLGRSGADAAQIWETAARDPAPLVANVARRKLKTI